MILREEGSGTKKEAVKMLAEQGIDMKKTEAGSIDGESGDDQKICK